LISIFCLVELPLHRFTSFQKY